MYRAATTTSPGQEQALYTEYADGWLYFGDLRTRTASSTSGGYITTHQAPISGRRASSVCFDGARVPWTDCAYPNANACAVRKRQWSVTWSLRIGVGAGNAQGDAGAMFWSDPQPKKYIH